MTTEDSVRPPLAVWEAPVTTVPITMAWWDGRVGMANYLCIKSAMLMGITVMNSLGANTSALMVTTRDKVEEKSIHNNDSLKKARFEVFIDKVLRARGSRAITWIKDCP